MVSSKQHCLNEEIIKFDALLVKGWGEKK